MGFDTGLIQSILNKMPIEAPKQAAPDTKLQNFQNSLPTINADSPAGKGVSSTYSPTSGQPSIGSPNQYSNTVGQWDNANIQPQSSSGGKGKGF